MSKISNFIWFEDRAEDAANFYVKLFPNSKIEKVTHYPKAAEHVAPGGAGAVMTVAFQLDDQHFTALNGGSQPEFTEHPGPVSFVVNCETQDEIDKFWDAFSDGGKPNQCGWVQDKFGITWQVVPTILPRLLSDPDPGVRERVTACFMKMTKFDIAQLQAAAKK